MSQMQTFHNPSKNLCLAKLSKWPFLLTLKNGMQKAAVTHHEAQGSLEKKVVPGVRQQMGGISLEFLVRLHSKEAIYVLGSRPKGSGAVSARFPLAQDG